MPYVTLERRLDIDKGLAPQAAGELSYLITQVMREYLLTRPDTWDTYADVIKAIDSAVDAFKKEVLWPHERTKQEKNGRVF